MVATTDPRFFGRGSIAAAGHSQRPLSKPRTDIAMPSGTRKQHADVREVRCTHCQRQSEVARRAMSIFCPHCKKRLILEDFKIRSYYAVRDFSTCGDIVVERRGHVVAPIKVGNLIVKGKVQSHVIARGVVTIGKTGWFKGDISASRLRVENGAVIDASVRIGMPPAVDVGG